MKALINTASDGLLNLTRVAAPVGADIGWLIEPGAGLAYRHRFRSSGPPRFRIGCCETDAEASMAEYDPEKLKAFWEYCETFKGWAKALVAGNAVGLGYCLTNLNSDTPRYNIGAFIALFGAGVLLGGLYFLILTIVKAEVTSNRLARTAWRLPAGHYLRGLRPYRDVGVGGFVCSRNPAVYLSLLVPLKRQRLLTG